MKTLIAVVAYNEEKSIQATIKDLGARDSGYDVAVIDNGSSDATVRLSAAMGVPVLNLCINTGGSAGVLTT